MADSIPIRQGYLEGKTPAREFPKDRMALRLEKRQHSINTLS
jgi:hypothetical protein